MPGLHLLVIDPQNDFCDPAGALFVPGADADMTRLSALIARLSAPQSRKSSGIRQIHVSLDTHHWDDIAHPAFWCDATSRAPAPFTIIRNSDLVSGRWRPVDSRHGDWALEYTARLEKNGRYALCVWPPHCLIGSWGTQVFPPVFDAIQAWERNPAAESGKVPETRLGTQSETRSGTRSGTRSVNFVYKGMNRLTEHYSALKADVERADDPGTGLNRELIAALSDADTLLIAGEALSHCVRFTVEDLIANAPADLRKRMIMLTDAASSVAGFEEEGRAFLDRLSAMGVRVARCGEIDL